MSLNKTVTLLIATILTLFISGCTNEDGSDLYTPDLETDKPYIRVMFIGQITDTANATPQPETAAAVRAATRRVNSEGGINGRLLQVFFCDDKADANEAARCARQAVSEGYVATVGNNSNFGDNIFPILENANLPSIGHNPISRVDFSSPMAFPLQTGSPGMVASTARLLAEQGARRIRIATVESPAGGLATEFARIGVKGTEAEVLGHMLVPIGAPDYASFAHNVSRDVDAVLVSMNADQAARFIVAMSQAVPEMTIGVPSIAIPPSTLKQIGPPAEGILVSANFLPINVPSPANDQFRADMARYAPEAKINGFSQQAWLAVEVFARAMSRKGVTDFTPKNVYAAMDSLKNLDTGDMTPPLTTTRERPKPFNRLFVDRVLYGKVKDGDVVLIDDQWQPSLWHD